MCQTPRPCVKFHNVSIFNGEEFLAPRATPYLEDHRLVGCLRLLVQYIRSHLFQPLTARHAEETDNYVTWMYNYLCDFECLKIRS